MLSHQLYSACISILIVENPFDLTKLLPSLLLIRLRSIDDDKKKNPESFRFVKSNYAGVSVK